jgi:hypothetical protein
MSGENTPTSRKKVWGYEKSKSTDASARIMQAKWHVVETD